MGEERGENVWEQTSDMWEG